jgi:hypothetical protein
MAGGAWRVTSAPVTPTSQSRAFDGIMVSSIANLSRV